MNPVHIPLRWNRAVAVLEFVCQIAAFVVVALAILGCVWLVSLALVVIAGAS